MKVQKIKFKSKDNEYPILIGQNILNLLRSKIKLLCPQTKKVALIFDTKVPNKFKRILIGNLKNYEVCVFNFNASEKSKNFKSASNFLDKLLSKNFNRSDLIIGIGGGITGDLTGFVASILKRGTNFINIPTTLLSQVDAAIGGKTGVNSRLGKNLIGSFSQPKLVLSDISFLKSLSKKDMVCGFAEILKHAIIKDKFFFNWLKLNTKYIFSHSADKIIYAINKDENEKNLRMILNFGHTFAHAIEIKNNYSKNTTHGEAVLAGMILETRLSYVKKICTLKTLAEIKNIYEANNLNYTIKKYSNLREINSLIPYLKNDKKNNDEKINFILLKKIGKTTVPNKNKISIKDLNKSVKHITQC